MVVKKELSNVKHYESSEKAKTEETKMSQYFRIKETGYRTREWEVIADTTATRAIHTILHNAYMIDKATLTTQSQHGTKHNPHIIVSLPALPQIKLQVFDDREKAVKFIERVCMRYENR